MEPLNEAKPYILRSAYLDSSASYITSVKIDPNLSSESFAGSVDIIITTKQPTQSIQLNAHLLDNIQATIHLF